MNPQEVLAEQFESQRTHLRAAAFRMLGSMSEADDAVQEAWIRLNRSDVSTVDNLRGWLTTVVARVSLDMLRSRQSRREEPLDSPRQALHAVADDAADPEHQAVLAEAVGLALLVVLDTLTPPERVAFVLHDLFAVPFSDIGIILHRSPEAAKQLASRARRRVQTGQGSASKERPNQQAIVEAFLAASRSGDFAGLLTLLDPQVSLRADPATVQAGASEVVLGATAVAGTLSGRAQAAQPALIDGSPGAVWAQGGRPLVAFQFTIIENRINAITMIADPHHLLMLDIELLGPVSETT